MVLAGEMGNDTTDGSLVPWEAGKPLTRDVTVVSPLADSYVVAAAHEAGSAAEAAAARKSAKYTQLAMSHIFQPIDMYFWD